MREYRCTRNQPYTAPGCPGRTDTRAREGHYLRAGSEAEALRMMRESFPGDWMGFTAELWK
jgi:hypothetical protein